MINRVYRLLKIARKLSTSGAVETINQIHNLPLLINIFFNIISIGSEKKILVDKEKPGEKRHEKRASTRGDPRENSTKGPSASAPAPAGAADLRSGYGSGAAHRPRCHGAHARGRAGPCSGAGNPAHLRGAVGGPQCGHVRGVRARQR